MYCISCYIGHRASKVYGIMIVFVDEQTSYIPYCDLRYYMRHFVNEMMARCFTASVAMLTAQRGTAGP